MLSRMIKDFMYYLFKVRGSTLTDEIRLQLAIARCLIRFPIDMRRTYLGFYIPGKKMLRIRTRDGYTFIVRPKTTDISLAILYTHEPYELKEWFLTYAKGIVIDVGANIGGYTVRACRQADLVVAIEPQLQAFEILKENVIQNCHKNNVVLVRKGIGDKKRKTVLKVPKRKDIIFSGEAYIDKKVENLNKEISFIDEEIELEPLDDIVKSLGIEKVDFLKIDIEGYEGTAFTGIPNTLRNTKYLMIEVKPENVWIIEELSKIGFRLLDKNEHNYFFINIVFSRNFNME
uniref:FkbM family methyltransferase n=1 Tax=Ignisphaera aggregans TaxID=334771 RepID=A0A832FPD0_9CREN